LPSELKKLDDKQMLTETHLLESRLHHSLENIPKAKAALTASRTAANSIYVTPLLQAELDEMSGILQCEEGDNTTAFSYFLEAFEAYDKGTDPRAVTCLKYMCLTKVLSYKAHEVPAILSNKSALKYVGPEIQSMTAVAKAATERSLEKFQAAVC
jgi:26S proteasome regulatory subunit N6